MIEKKNTDKRYATMFDNVEEQTKAEKIISKNELWEQKMKAKGFKTVQVLGEMVPTYVFASPDRQKEIAQQNRLYLKSVKDKREVLKKSN